MKAVLIRKSTQQVLKKGTYPRIDLAPIEGLDSDLEWLIPYEPNLKPNYDSRLYNLETIETITTDPHPTYPAFNQYQITYNLVRRTDEEIQSSIEEIEYDSNQSLIPTKDMIKYLTIGVGLILSKMDSSGWAAKEVLVKDKLVAIAIKIWQNDQAVKDKVSELLGGTLPDLNTGFENE